MATKMKYNVLVPQYHEAGRNHKHEMTYYVSFKTVGKTNSLAKAKEKFGVNIVLEEA